ncbi:MAG TPA: serine/threonine-protein kinase [Kofleriaceae bacterium]|nr:serine/threonine-protein kinase [Kofleriaceae bacterium]
MRMGSRPPGVPQSRTDPLIGCAVGHWRVTRAIGRGGMASVYEAVDAAGGRVALKVMAPEVAADADAVARFFAEARVAAAVRHPGLVDVIAMAYLPDGRPFIAMEYLDGAPLGALLRRGLPLGSLAAAIVQALDALHAAHACGVIHRDLKPDNLFVLRDGRAKLLDFGLAKLPAELGAGVPATGDGRAMGTPPYMAPEYVRGGRHDARSDLYAMGVVLFEASTARLPFAAADHRALFRLHVTATPPAPRSLRPDMPAGYESVILQALFKTPELRFASAADMADTLRKASRELPAEAWAPLLR